MSEENRIRIQRDVDAHRHELVLDGGDFNVCRLVGWTDEFDEDDFCFILFYPKNSARPGVVFFTCVAGFIPLKGHIDDDHYDCMETSWSLNEPSSLEIEDRVRQEYGCAIL